MMALEKKLETGAPLSAQDIELWWRVLMLPGKVAFSSEYYNTFVAVSRVDDLGWESVEDLIQNIESHHNEIAAHNDAVYGERFLKTPPFDSGVSPYYIGNLNYGKRVKFRKWFTGVKPYHAGVDPADDVLYLDVPGYANARNFHDVSENGDRSYMEYWIVGDKLYTIWSGMMMEAIRNRLAHDDRKRKMRLEKQGILPNGAYEDDDWGYDYDDDDYSSGGGSGGNDRYSQAELDNHANQCNPNNDAYWSSRG